MEEKLYKGKDESLMPGYVVYDPLSHNSEKKYADEERMYQGIPTIERTPGGTLLYAFYSGGVTEQKGNFILLYRDEGKTDFDFRPIAAIEPPTPDCRVFDPCLWVDPQGRLWFFYAQSYAVGQHYDSRYGVWALVCDKPDEKIEFSAPRRIANGIMMNKPTVMKDGRWLLPCAIWHAFPTGHNYIPEENFSNVYASFDNGESFELIGHSAAERRMIDEHMILELDDGRAMMYIRSEGGISRSFSSDGGRTWDDEAGLIHLGTNSRFCLRRLKSGNVLLVYHPNGVGRSFITAWLSTDGGMTFDGGLLLDERRETSYPDMTEDEDGNIYICYDYNRQTDKEMMLAVVTEEDILAGKLVSAGSKLKILVNKGLAENPAVSKN